MKRTQLKKLILLLTVATVIGGSPVYSNAITMDKADVQTVNEVSEVTNKDENKLSKYEGINGQEWINNNKILRAKAEEREDGKNKIVISIYDLNTKEDKVYENVNIDELYGISPNGRYVLFGEPRHIPTVGSEEWQQALDSGELLYKKHDILDLQTGEIIVDFDKTPHNYESQYKWINDDYIFVNHFSCWKVMNKNGQVIKEGTYDYTGYANEWAHLVDVSELKVDGDKVSGSFYYTKEYMGSDRNLGVEIFSMDVNDKEEKSIKKCDYSNDVRKAGDIMTVEFFNNNGGAVGGYFVNRTFGFNILDTKGNLVRTYELPFGKNYLNFSLSPDGEKCAFVEIDGYMNENADPNYAVLKVLNIKTGEVEEVAKLKDLMNPEKESGYYDFSQHIQLKYSVRLFSISNLSWNKDGSRLMFNYSYTSKEDGKNYTSTYIKEFNK